MITAMIWQQYVIFERFADSVIWLESMVSVWVYHTSIHRMLHAVGGQINDQTQQHISIQHFLMIWKDAETALLRCFLHLFHLLTVEKKSCINRQWSSPNDLFLRLFPDRNLNFTQPLAFIFFVPDAVNIAFTYWTCDLISILFHISHSDFIWRG